MHLTLELGHFKCKEKFNLLHIRVVEFKKKY